jgi:hypothetical protein
VLCCAVLCCAVLCCAVLCCAVLCCAVLCCAVLCCCPQAVLSEVCPIALGANANANTGAATPTTKFARAGVLPLVIAFKKPAARKKPAGAGGAGARPGSAP